MTFWEFADKHFLGMSITLVLCLGLVCQAITYIAYYRRKT